MGDEHTLSSKSFFWMYPGQKDHGLTAVMYGTPFTDRGVKQQKRTEEKMQRLLSMWMKFSSASLHPSFWIVENFTFPSRLFSCVGFFCLFERIV